MTNNLFVGGFPYETTQEELTNFFAACGKVVSVKILTDKETGRSRGIGFVVMGTEAEAQAAIAKLNGQMLGSRKIFVDIAKPQEKRPGGFGPKPGGFGPKPGGFGPKPGGFGSPDKKPWADRPSWEQEKRGPSSDRRKKRWDDRGEGGGGKKWGGKGRKGGRDDDFED